MNDPTGRPNVEDVDQYDEIIDDLVDLTAAFEADPADVTEQHREIPLDDELDR